MIDAVAQIARAAAEQLASEYGPALAGGVEAALYTRESSTKDKYADPIAIGGLIVSIATLAWQIYQDLKSKSDKPAPEVLARTIRVRSHETMTSTEQVAIRDRITEIVVDETIRRDSQR